MVWTQKSYLRSVSYDRPGECSPEIGPFVMASTDVSTIWVACVASVFVGLSPGLKHFSLLERAKIGASAKKRRQKAKNASNGRKTLRKRLLRRLRSERKSSSESSKLRIVSRCYKSLVFVSLTSVLSLTFYMSTSVSSPVTGRKAETNASLFLTPLDDKAFLTPVKGTTKTTWKDLKTGDRIYRATYRAPVTVHL